MSREDIMMEMCELTPTGSIRKFETGATRDTDNGKHDPEGFLSPLVINRFNEFMHSNRCQKNGSFRDSDNWQKGIPLPVYAKSLWRHFLDFWLHHRGFGYRAKEPIQVALCAIIFNAAGYLHELLKYENPNNNKAAGQAGGIGQRSRDEQTNPKVEVY